jgi:hypothetical protein
LIPIDITTETDTTIITGKYMSKKSEQNKFHAGISIQTKLTKHARNDSLLSNIKILIDDENSIHTMLTQPSTFDIATDGSHDQASGKLAYGWVIALNKLVIASGQGPAMAHPDLAESFRVESYGLASAAAFLNFLVQTMLLDPTTHKWNFHIDSLTLITRMTKHATECPTSKWNHWPDINITTRAHTLLNKIPAVYHHVKSHQNGRNQSPDLIVQMNEMADELATQQRAAMSTPKIAVDGDFCQIVINDSYITRESQKWLMDTSGKIPIQKYYYDNYKWSQATFDDINWPIQHKAMTSFSPNDIQRITKFCHSWLPTYDRLFREKLSPNQRCPLCHYLIESNNHLFSCRHPAQQKSTQALLKFLDDDSDAKGNCQLNNIIKQAIIHCHSPTWSPDTDHLEPELAQCVMAQSKIGWGQILHGRITKQMEQYMEKHFQQNGNTEQKDTGARWSKLLIKAIWENMLQRWRQRNEVIYGAQILSQQETQ